jgi:NAD(P)-dependent dehydrogenase (short-subunit alcohol dehydrogenase family)
MLLPLISILSTVLWSRSIITDLGNNILTSRLRTPHVFPAATASDSNSTRAYFIAGHSRGIGRAIVDEILSLGQYTFLVLAGRGTGNSTAEIRNGRVHFVYLDLNSSASDLLSQTCFNCALAGGQYPIDTVIQNAGLMSKTAAADEIHRVNCFSPFLATLALLPRVLRGDNSKVLAFITSSSHLRARQYIPGTTPWIPRGDGSKGGQSALSAYADSKFNIMLLSAALKRRLHTVGVEVIYIHPGLVDTDMLQGYMGKIRFPGRGRLFLSPRDAAARVLEAVSRSAIAGATAWESRGQLDSNEDFRKYYYVDGRAFPSRCSAAVNNVASQEAIWSAFMGSLSTNARDKLSGELRRAAESQTGTSKGRQQVLMSLADELRPGPGK